MPKARITNLRSNRRKLLSVWFGLWLDKALERHHGEGKAFPGLTADETRKLLLTLKDLRDDCEATDAEIIETGGYNDIPYGRRH